MYLARRAEKPVTGSAAAFPTVTLALPRGDLPDNGAVRLAPRFRICKPSARTRTRLNDIVRGRRGVTADTALRLARYLGTSAEFWLGLQLEYDLRMTRQAKQKEIERAVRPRFRGALNLGVSSGREERDPRERNHGFVPLGAAIQNARKNWISETEQLGTSDRSGNIT